MKMSTLKQSKQQRWLANRKGLFTKYFMVDECDKQYLLFA
jgi:hypothetical protein